MAHRVADDSRVVCWLFSFPSVFLWRFSIFNRLPEGPAQKVGGYSSWYFQIRTFSPYPSSWIVSSSKSLLPHLIPSVDFITQLLVIAELGPFSVLAEKQVIQLGKNVITQFISQNKMFSMCKPFLLFLFYLLVISVQMLKNSGTIGLFLTHSEWEKYQYSFNVLSHTLFLCIFC